MSTFIEKFDWKKAGLIGGATWVFAFFFGWALMSALGVNPQEEQFGPQHSAYWTFEAIIIPVFIVIGLAVFIWYFRSTTNDPSNWITEALLVGLTVMVIQFALDTIFLVIILDGGIEYFVALVTVSYLLIPVWCLVSGYYERVYRVGA